MLTIKDLLDVVQEYNLDLDTPIVFNTADTYYFADAETELDCFVFDERSKEALMSVKGDECIVLFQSV